MAFFFSIYESKGLMSDLEVFVSNLADRKWHKCVYTESRKWKLRFKGRHRLVSTHEGEAGWIKTVCQRGLWSSSHAAKVFDLKMMKVLKSFIIRWLVRENGTPAVDPVVLSLSPPPKSSGIFGISDVMSMQRLASKQASYCRAGGVDVGV